MAEFVDQFFILLKHWMLSRVPPAGQPIVSALLSVVPVLIVFPALFAFVTVLERKWLGRIQNRYGPNRVGPYGLLQPMADAIKTLTKEAVLPRGADGIAHLSAPVLLVVAALMAYAVLPVGRNMIVVDLNSGVLYFFAVGALVELAIFMAGWSGRNKYALIGAMRAIAQMISYEVPLVLASVVVVMAAGTLSTVGIVEAQSGYSYGWPHWFLFTPWGFVGFLLFMVAATAEANRSPFDLPEGESEIIAGYYTEYAGFKFALFFLAEYLGMFATTGMAVTLFLGGWSAPASFLIWVPTYIWFFVKLFMLITLFIWIRGTLPRLRMDHLMKLAWKVLLPLALFNIALMAIWNFIVIGIIRWGICLLLSLVVLIFLQSWLGQSKSWRREYKYSEE
jgi:NADH-quinone oxidoreductase subunit H